MYNPTLKRIVITVFRWFFLRRAFFPFHKIMFKLSLHGMGILNYESKRLSGEEAFLKRGLVSVRDSQPVVIDVGANIGEYSMLAKRIAPDAHVYAFEPHPDTFKKLEAVAKAHRFQAFNFGCDEVEGQRVLYDYVKDGSSHASLEKRVITEIHGRQALELPVRTVRLDDFLQQELNIRHVNLLKVDTEGNELRVLRGAQRMLAANAVDVIQFEFNEMNVLTRVFFKDFVDLLPNYEFFRLLPDGEVPLGVYHAVPFEIFAFQNIAAVRKDFAGKWK